VRLDVHATRCSFWDEHAYFGQESVSAAGRRRLRSLPLT
jgi:hypothetical protein